MSSVSIPDTGKREKQSRARSPKMRIDLPTKRRKRFGRPNNRGPRRDNRKSRYDNDYTGDDERHNAEFEEYYRMQKIVPEEELPTLLRTLASPLPSSFRILKDSPYRKDIEDTLHGPMTELCQRVVKEREALQLAKELRKEKSKEKTKESKEETQEEGDEKSRNEDKEGDKAESNKEDKKEDEHKDKDEKERESKETLREVIQRQINEDDVEFKPISPLKWYPEELAWSVSAPRQMLRRDNVLAPLHQFLVSMNDIGAINRQESVSMIPPLLLEAKCGEAVIDMCAAPGSKTAQILESFMASEEGRNKQLSDPGVVIANDAEMRRCWMLAHQLKRFSCPDLVITHHDAQFFPTFMTFDRVLCDVPCSGDGTLRKAPDIWRRWNSDMGLSLHRLQCQIAMRGVEILKPGGRLVYSTCSLNPVENEAVVAYLLSKFADEIELLDCSDLLPGLIRRPGLHSWLVKDRSPKWDKPATKGTRNDAAPTEQTDKINGEKKTENGEDISKKENDESAMDVSGEGQEPKVKEIGGNGDQAVTNKKESDAGVIAQEAGNGKDSENAEELEERKGPIVLDPKIPGWFTCFDEVPHRRRKKIVRSLFPPTKEEIDSGKFPLDRCMRLVPHDQDTGAFFVAVFQKKSSAKVTKKQLRVEEIVQKRDENDKKKEEDRLEKWQNEKGEGNEGASKDAPEVDTKDGKDNKAEKSNDVKDDTTHSKAETGAANGNAANADKMDIETATKHVDKPEESNLENCNATKSEIEGNSANGNATESKAEEAENCVVTNDKIGEAKNGNVSSEKARDSEDVLSNSKDADKTADDDVDKADSCKKGDSVQASKDKKKLNSKKDDCLNGVDVKDHDETMKSRDGSHGKFGGLRPRGSRLIVDDALEEVRNVAPKTLDGIIDYFGIEPSVAHCYLMTRGVEEGSFNKVIAVSRTVRMIIRHGLGSRDKSIPFARRSLRIVNAGTRVLERTDRNDSECPFRLVHDGVRVMRKVMQKRIFEHEKVTRQLILPLLKTKEVRLADVEGEELEVWKSVIDMGSGSAIIICENEEVIVWVGKRIITAVMTPDLLKALLTKFEDNNE